MEQLFATINSGSSSVRLGLYAVSKDSVRAMKENRRIDVDDAAGSDRGQVLADYFGRDCADIALVAHRFVHGGVKHVRPTRLSPSLVSELEEVEALAPLHTRRSLDWYLRGALVA
ncbi:MAG: hypothetical protein KDD44_00720, partial [Bdellovibrionales bacterium]|nr:hypothetical protein [Bdellovibrionales bacterium]